MRICPGCGEENPDRFRLCGICGTPLVESAPAPEVRKTVTIVFCDLKGSTNLGESLDTEALREVLSIYFREMRSALERHGGTVEKYIGDAVMAVFGLPRLHEDDALRAVRAALDMQEALAGVNQELDRRYGIRLENRTGVNTGEVVAGDVTSGQRLVTGDAVNVAARLEQAAPTMEILIGEPTYRLVRDAVEVEEVEPLPLKGKSEPVPAYRLLDVPRGEGYARRMDSPIIGRRPELDRLNEALRRAEATTACQLVTVLGPAGVGKSRLIQEFLHRSESRARILQGRCLPYGEGITFWPLAEVVREAAGISDEDHLEVARSKLLALLPPGDASVADRVAAAIGLSSENVAVEETFLAARRLFEILAEERPLIVLFDDIHWAEATFLELLGHVHESAAAPIVFACSARDELFEEHPGWPGEDTATGTAIRLAPLSEAESAAVIEQLLGSATLDESVRARVVEAAEGNPLFVEQLLSMLVDDGTLQADAQGRWVSTTDLGSLTVPPTIAALLTARLDRLPPDERTVIERGAVIGKVFYRGAVEALVPDHVREQVGVCLLSLISKGFARPHEATFAGQDAFEFAHILIRDAAYHGLLKRSRSELHVGFVDWLEGAADDRAMEYEEIRGYHLEQAYLILIQLGAVDAETRAIGGRGARYLARAGGRATARGDLPAAANLLQRAAALLSDEDPARPSLLLDLSEVQIDLGEFSIADETLQATRQAADGQADRGLVSTVDLVRLQLRYTTDPVESEEEVYQIVVNAVPELEALGDHRGLARAWQLLAAVHGTACRYGDAEHANLNVIEHARLAGDRLLEIQPLGSVALCALYGPTPVDEAVGRCEQLLIEAGGDRRSESLLMCALSHLCAMKGDFEQARGLYRRSREVLEELGFKLLSALTSIDSGSVEMLAGDAAAAEAELRRDYRALDDMGERNYISTTAGLLAESLYLQERYDEAEEFASISESVAASDDIESQVLWRGVRGKLLARRNRADDGIDMLEEGVRIIGKTDELDAQGNALMDLGEVLRLAGRTDEAADVVGHAAKLFEQKGNVVSLRRAERALA